MAVELLGDDDDHGVVLAQKAGMRDGHVDDEGGFGCGYVKENRVGGGLCEREISRKLLGGATTKVVYQFTFTKI